MELYNLRLLEASDGDNENKLTRTCEQTPFGKITLFVQGFFFSKFIEALKSITSLDFRVVSLIFEWRGLKFPKLSSHPLVQSYHMFVDSSN